ncbi:MULTISPECIES: universal stress protein [Rhodococcus]|uniref:Universal stress protein n=1 Tax=Rhodococcus cerastii TaxID=908616 RepID=A0ABU4D4S2_9NOCA|nr:MULTISPECIES: universal stress protein [Rhodococcus]MDI9927200.1 universal stress protein [Rhodococcus sp. IEGM 1341]MDV6304718.1 universal stress protein [Rhodococcus cerastii]MDV8056265.1 universal stress protein [Rhodococcus sp. IEGM 1343]MDV8077825.1 universal stress protein [Rhodococcus sp. IEGM 1370]
MVSAEPRHQPTDNPVAPGFWTKHEWGDIVVALDGTVKSRDALSWAAGLASVTGARIRLVHALTSRESARSLERLHGRRLLRSARRELFGLDPRIAIDSILTDDPIASVLGALSHTADLIVIGGRESGPIRDVLFGRNATRIVEESSCPVLVWRPQHADLTPTSPVVVGVDHSDSCTRAIEAAFWFADALEVPLTALHVGSPHRRPVTNDAELEQIRALEWLGGRLDAAKSMHPTVDVHLHLLDASAEHELRLASATAHLLVVGSRGPGPWTGPFTGSVGQSLVHASGCPILVVR